jgi:hypothetical protein
MTFGAVTLIIEGLSHETLLTPKLGNFNKVAQWVHGKEQYP